jgi:hypothetical protein
MPTGFPIPNRGRINAEFHGQLPLRQAEPFPLGGKAVWEALGDRDRVVAQEPEKSQAEMGAWAFPYEI